MLDGLPAGHPLIPTLEMAVTLRLLMLQDHPERRPKAEDMILCLECQGQGKGCATCGDHLYVRRSEAYSFYIAAHGDVLMYGGKPGQAAKAFNVLAEGLTMMAYYPGGVTLGPLHFEVKPEWTRVVHKTEPPSKVIVNPC